MNFLSHLTALTAAPHRCPQVFSSQTSQPQQQIEQQAMDTGTPGGATPLDAPGEHPGGASSSGFAAGEFGGAPTGWDQAIGLTPPQQPQARTQRPSSCHRPRARRVSDCRALFQQLAGDDSRFDFARWESIASGFPTPEAARRERE